MVKIVLSMAAMIVAYVLASALTVPVSMALKSATPVYDTIEKSVSTMVKESKVDSTSIEKLNLPAQIEEKIMVAVIDGNEIGEVAANDMLDGDDIAIMPTEPTERPRKTVDIDIAVDE